MSQPITEANFYEIYKPQFNHIERAKQDASIASTELCSFGGCMYETYGPEYDYVREVMEKDGSDKRVWTVIDAEGDLVITSGHWSINRMGYLITEKQWEERGVDVQDDEADISPDDITPGEWEAIIDDITLIVANGTTVCELSEYYRDGGDEDLVPNEEQEANAEAICKAVNNTYGKGINPKYVPELFQMVRDLKDCIHRLTADGVPQAERDAEAEWEGNAHELLTKANPNYYKNANA